MKYPEIMERAKTRGWRTGISTEGHEGTGHSTKCESKKKKKKHEILLVVSELAQNSSRSWSYGTGSLKNTD